LTVAASVVGLAFASGVFEGESSGDRLLGLAASVLASLGYTVSRAIVKK
jgi:phosphoribosylaminoimidazole (AIR) synthetase